MSKLQKFEQDYNDSDIEKICVRDCFCQIFKGNCDICCAFFGLISSEEFKSELEEKEKEKEKNE